MIMRKIKISYLLFLFLSPIGILSQSAPSKYWVQFKNKNSTPHTISSPLTYLSQRAVNRRVKQNIAIDSTDLPITPSYLSAIAAFDSITILNRSKWFNAITIRTTDTISLNAIKALPFVKKTEPVGIIKWKDELENNHEVATITNQQTFSKVKEPTAAYNYGSSATQINMIGINCMHANGYKGKGMIIAVLDAGFYKADVAPAFDSLYANNRILGTWDFVKRNDSVYEDHSHGMLVLSTMAALQPGKIIGTAPHAQYYLLRTEEAATEYLIEEDNWVAAAEFADSVGADIINSSLGYTTFDDPSQNHSYSDLDGNTARITIGADYAAKKGMVVANSAGNSGSSAWHYIGAPADGDSVLTVGGVDAYRSYASFSSVGPSYDGRIKPNVSAMAQGTCFALSNGDVAFGNGTSFSSPLIAGAVACLWQANPSAGNMEIIKAIEQSCDNHLTPDNITGYGIPDICIANQILKGSSPDNFIDDNIVQVYTSPFNDNFSFSFYSSSNQDIAIALFDCIGKKIIEEEKNVTANSYNLYHINNLSGLASGIYFLTVTTEIDDIHTYKVVKNTN